MPVSFGGDRYGYGRGASIDRRYIEQFLGDNAAVIRGRCLEVGDDRYTKLFGGDKVESVDVLDVDATNEAATIIGDLHDLSHLDSSSYDCVIVTQVLQYLADPSAGVREIRRILAPGGTALVTVPTMAPADHVSGDMFRFMPRGAKRLFEGSFDSTDLVISSFGNQLTGLAYWTGLAQEDLPPRAWRSNDPTYPLIVAIRALARQA